MDLINNSYQRNEPTTYDALSRYLMASQDDRSNVVDQQYGLYGEKISQGYGSQLERNTSKGEYQYGINPYTSTESKFL